MQPLIFERLNLQWKDLLPPGVVPACRNQAGSLPLYTFGGPSDAFQKSIEGVRESRAGLEFPDWGQWRLIGGFGALKVLLIDPAKPRDDIPREVCAFVSANCWHRRTDHHLAHIDGDRRFFHFDRLAEKFFYSDQPLGLYCVYVSRFLATLLDHLGFEVRLGSVSSTHGGHTFPEVFLPEQGRWVIVDPDFGVMLRSGGEWLSGQEMCDLAANHRENEIEMVDIGKKCFPSREAAIVMGSIHGQLTWQPEMMDPDFLCTSSYWTNVVLRRHANVLYKAVNVVKRMHVSIDSIPVAQPDGD